MSYKPELDGLRGIAIFLVLLCHMRLLGATGGFIGVDIFFVLSGFLITSIIVGGIEKDNFGFWNFFGRRLARLYPALLTTVALTMLAGFLIADPESLRKIARVARYVILSISNIFFTQNLGYFDQSAQKQVFLHTWSLGVEWQFYIVWPFLIWGVMRLTKKSKAALVTVILAVILASLFASQWAIQHDTRAAYYLFYYRAFELGIGALLTFIYPKKLVAWQGKTLVAIGMLVILCCAFIFYTPETPFPGYAAFIPCLATAACMWGSQSFERYNFLRSPPLVFIGKASYSIYLVHWPLLVLTQYYFYRNLSTLENSVLLITAVLLGIAIYLIVERHINWRSWQHKRKGSMALLAASALLLGVAIYSDKSSKGLPWRLGNHELLQPQYVEWGLVHTPPTATLGAPDGKLVAIVAGDSFAANMSSGFIQYLTPRQEQALRFYSPGCLISLINLKGINPPEVCKAKGQEAIEAALAHPDLPLILIQAWGGPALDADARGEVFTDIAAQAVYHEQLAKNLDDLRARLGTNRPIFIIASPPYRHWDVSERECLLRPSYVKQLCTEQTQPYAPAETATAYANQALKEYAQTHEHFYYISAEEQLCPDGLCQAEHNAKLYFDGYHTSIYGANLIIENAMQQIEVSLERKN